jgi:hypothetical protein
MGFAQATAGTLDAVEDIAQHTLQRLWERSTT